MRRSALPFRAAAAAVVGLLCLSACEQHPASLASPANSESRAAPSPPVPEPSAPVTGADAPNKPKPLIAVPAKPEPVQDEAPGVRALQEGMPPDVRDFIRRAVNCNHWAGEEPYNEERRAQMAAAVSSLLCRELDTDQKELRSRYAKDSAVLARIAQSRRAPL
jgi:hypothetical protein